MLPAAGDEEGAVCNSLMFLSTLPSSLLLPVRSVGIEGVSRAAPERKGCRRGYRVDSSFSRCHRRESRAASPRRRALLAPRDEGSFEVDVSPTGIPSVIVAAGGWWIRLSIVVNDGGKGGQALVCCAIGRPFQLFVIPVGGEDW